MPYEVCTPVYEGPFDLLLHLILRQEVELWEVSLARIVDEYLAELERRGWVDDSEGSGSEGSESIDLEVATEFLLIAATLVELKARRLLPGLEKERDSLDYCLSGLSDLTSSYLPARDVRAGEVWDLHDAASLGNLVEMMRFLATINPRPEGFPQGKLEGRVGEPTPETKDGEACVRLKVALQALCEGEVVAPARAGYISSVAKVEGKAWVSVETGVLWALETVAEGRATYKKSNSQEERRVRQFVTLATKRVDPNATPGDK